MVGLVLRTGLGLDANPGGGALGGGPAPPYHADAVHFDGNAWLGKAGLTGVPGEFTQVLLSFWLKMPNTDLANIFGSAPLGVILGAFAAGGDYFKLLVTDPNTNTDASAANTAPTTSWAHVLIAYDQESEAGTRVLINGSNVSDLDFSTDATPTLEGETFYLASDVGEAGTVCDVAEFYIAFNQWLDLSNAANVAKFIAGGKPVDLGADGSTPTGAAPTIFFSGDAAGFGTNKGTGGAFTLTGSLTNASTSPSD